MPQQITQSTLRHALHTIIDTDAHPPCWLLRNPPKRLPRIHRVDCPSGDYRNVSIRKAVYLIHCGIVYTNHLVWTRCHQYYCLRPNHLKSGTRATYKRDYAKRRATGRTWI